MVEVFLNKLAEINFQLFDVYQEFIKLDGKLKKDDDYQEKRKVIIEKIATLRASEDLYYEEFRRNPELAIKCLYYIEARQSSHSTVEGIHQSLDITKSNLAVQERIKGAIEQICLESGKLITREDNILIDVLCVRYPKVDRFEIINRLAQLKNKFVRNLTLKCFGIMDDFLQDVDNEQLRQDMIKCKHFRTFINRSVEDDCISHGFNGYTRKLKEEGKNNFDFDEELVNTIYECLAAECITSTLPNLLVSNIGQNSLVALFDLQGALLYLDEDKLSILFYKIVCSDAKNSLFARAILSAIKDNKQEKKKFNADLDIEKEF